MTDSTGAFSLTLGATIPWLDPINVDIIYKGTATSSGFSTGLRITDEGNGTRTDRLPVYEGGTSSGGTYAMGDVTVSGNYDCELFRIAMPILRDYHDRVHARPLAGELTIFRASDDAPLQLGPLAHYDDILLPANFVDKARRRVEARTNTLYHEFGHTIRHRADGTEGHWEADTIAYMYAQHHSSTEINRSEYAFNEGWGQYWRIEMRNNGPYDTNPVCPGAILPPGVQCFENAVSDPGNLDWVENLIANRLFELSQEISSSRAPDVMVQILQRNPYRIHSLYEFEEAYCLIVPLPNSFCTPGRRPTREPSECPVGYSEQSAQEQCWAPTPHHSDDEGQVPTYTRQLSVSTDTITTFGAVTQGEWDYQLPIAVRPGTTLAVSLAGITGIASGDPDLYVRFGGPPSTATFDCASRGTTATESCVRVVPADQHLAYIGVRGVGASNNHYTLKVSNVTQTGAAYSYSASGPGPYNLMTVDAGESRRYLPLRVNPGDHFRVSTVGNTEQLFTRFDSPPGTIIGTYDCFSTSECEGVVPADAHWLHLLVRGTADGTNYALHAEF
ncbi:hypothetical protein ACMHYB_01530 [Sorangium sp. So ce1128]